MLFRRGVLRETVSAAWAAAMDRLKTDSEQTSRWNTVQPHWNSVGLTNIYIEMTLNMTNRLQTQITARCVRVARFLSV
jgi:hypothetical protein